MALCWKVVSFQSVHYVMTSIRAIVLGQGVRVSESDSGRCQEQALSSRMSIEANECFPVYPANQENFPCHERTSDVNNILEKCVSLCTSIEFPAYVG
jgi:hypothetical protein